ncbi:MAG: site-specific DNA-methyltransferase [Caldilineaceae bacterium]
MDKLLTVNHVTAQLLEGDCLTRLGDIQSNTVDLIVTSPPYGNQRKSTYGGIHPDKYVDWFLPRAQELMRVLKPTGTFILNIKENARGGERHPYVIQLILALRNQGWLWTEEFIWHKKNAVPGKWPNRFRDAWERLLHFNLQRKFTMYQDEVMVPISKHTKATFKYARADDHVRIYSPTGSGANMLRAKFRGRTRAYPSNVLYLAVEPRNQGHSAVFPKTLPSWFIRLFTQAGDMVLDPFMGSGTTCAAAIELGRHAIGIDTQAEYIKLAHKRILGCTAQDSSTASSSDGGSSAA